MMDELKLLLVILFIGGFIGWSLFAYLSISIFFFHKKGSDIIRELSNEIKEVKNEVKKIKINSLTPKSRK
jgi:hypothetical protein